VDVIQALIRAELPHLVAFRHDLHRHPELSFEERRTSQVIQRELSALGVQFRAGYARGTGIVAHIPATDAANNKKPAIALRADMDALPIVERTGKPYSSQNPGVAHSCGHDGHTAILLGALRVLLKLPRPSPVTFFFQPAEENEGGGKEMCAEGALLGDGRGGLGTPVGQVFGLHGWPQLRLGQIATKVGPIMAAVDDFVVDVVGTQAHGAYPHLGRDPVLAAAHVVTALQSIASRNVGPLDSVVCTVGKIEGGTANNIIPERVRLIGTVRTLRDATQTLARERFFETVEHAARAQGCRAEIDWHEGYPVVHNDAGATERVLRTARTALGAERVEVLEHPTMGGEDFAFYGRHAPACFFFLGLRPHDIGPDQPYPSLHQPEFDFNDAAIPTGVEMFVRLAVEG
jgi:amidohydrolase